MSAKIHFPPGQNYIPQADFDANPTENGGWEGSQSFLSKKSGLVRNSAIDAIFRRGVPITTLDPNCPSAYSFLRLKLFVISDHAPGIVAIKCTFTGYAAADSNGSSGDEVVVETYSLRGNLEDAPLSDHKKWTGLTDESKKRLGLLLKGLVVFFMDDNTWGSTGGEGNLDDASVSAWPAPVDDELKFARLIAQDKVTYKKPAWDYNVRTEGSKGFTSAQLSKLGKIATPPGDPIDPGNGWKWMLVGPDQEQSGEKRFYKDLRFQLIEDNDENTFLYAE